jgi:hypothetical protein
MNAADISNLGELARWLTEHSLTMTARSGRGDSKLCVVEIRQVQTRLLIVVGTGRSWKAAVYNAMLKVEEQQEQTWPLI